MIEDRNADNSFIQSLWPTSQEPWERQASKSVKPKSDFLQKHFAGVTHGQVILAQQISIEKDGKTIKTYKRLGMFDLPLGPEADELAYDKPDVLFKICAMDGSKISPTGIGGKDAVTVITGFSVDLDCGKDDRYPSVEQAMQAMQEMPLYPSRIVGSNGKKSGRHAYWDFDQPVEVNSENYVELLEISRAWQNLLRDRIKAIDPRFTLDETASPERLLRVVGSTRSKSGNRVTLIEDTGAKYTLEEILSYVELPKPEPRTTAMAKGDSAIERYLTLNEIDVSTLLATDDRLSVCGDEFANGLSSGEWIHSQSTSGARTLVEATSRYGDPGVYVFSSGCPFLSEGWHGIVNLFVALRHEGNYKQAAAFSYKWLDDYMSDLEALGMLSFEELAAYKLDMEHAAMMTFKPDKAQRGKSKVDTLRFPVYGPDGDTVTTFDLDLDGKETWAKGGERGLFLTSKPEPGESWLIVEGLRNAIKLCSMGYPNVIGLPGNALQAPYAKMLEGCDVTVIPALDGESQLAAQRTGAVLVGIASNVGVVRLPGEVTSSNGDDLRTITAQFGSRIVKDSIDNPSDWEPAEGHVDVNSMPQVLLRLNEGIVAKETIQHLGKLGWDSPWVPKDDRESYKMYVRNGTLVHVTASEDPKTKGKLQLSEMPQAIIRQRISSSCLHFTEGEDSKGNIVMRPERVPNWLVDSIAHQKNYDGNVRYIEGVITAPTLRPDGSILQTPGWDEETCLLYKPTADFPEIPESPSRDDAIAAWKKVKEVTIESLFETEHDRSAWFSLVLTMLCRPCIKGYTPLYAASAKAAGTGKGILFDTSAIIAYGQKGATVKALPKRPEEFAKLITTVLFEGSGHFVFDNIDCSKGPFQNEDLEALLTAESFKDRILGKTQSTGDMQNLTVWGITGNNLHYQGDLCRRVLPIRLDAGAYGIEDPKTRSFKDKSVKHTTMERRPELVAACLTFLRAYFVAGCPEQGGSWASYDEWFSIIRGAIVWAGLPDPYVTAESLNEVDGKLIQTRRLIAAIEEADPDGKGVTVSQMGAMLETFECHPELVSVPLLKEIAFEVCGSAFSAVTFGRALGHVEGTLCGGKKLNCRSVRGGKKAWTVVSNSPKPMAISSGDFLDD